MFHQAGWPLAAFLLSLLLAEAAWAEARHHHLKPQHGVASYYRAPKGTPTASGKPFSSASRTAASPTLPLGAKAKVTNEKTGQSTNVTVTDRGPYAKGRILDVSPKAADDLGLKDKGVAPVKVQPTAVPAKSD